MSETAYDAIVLGGGPGGASAAMYLALSGKRVLLLEKERFPRFHIGESLLPYNNTLFRDLGIMKKMQNAGFPVKYGAQFHLSNGSQTVKFVFANGCFTREHQSFQVERAAFDKLLLDHAREIGVDVREACAATRFVSDPDTITVHTRNDSGDCGSVSASFMVDATGRANLTGNQENLREFHPKMKRVAIFGHFAGVGMDAGASAGDTVILRFEDKWIWLIPLSPSKVSVGLVMDKSILAQSNRAPADLFFETIKKSAAAQKRMINAELVSDIKVTSDFSYCNKRLHSHRLLRVGDAAGFMDPIFSAGVYLAMYSGKLAAEHINNALAVGHSGEGTFPAYSRRIFRAMRLYWRMVEYFYKPAFVDLFMRPSERVHVASAVNALLAGELDGGWTVRWRMELFFLLVRIQRFFPIATRAQYD